MRFIKPYFSGQEQGGGDSTTVGTGSILYVSTVGNNSRAKKGNPFRAWLTIDAAVAAASSGDTIAVFAGSYTLADNMFKDGVKYTSIGRVVITKDVAGNMFDYSGAVQDISVKGDFYFKKITNAGKVFYAAGSPNISINIVIYRAENSTDKTFELRTSNAVTLNVSGEMYSSADNAIDVFGCSNATFVFYGKTTSTVAAGIYVSTMTNSPVYKHDLTTGVTAIVCDLSQASLPNSFLAFDDAVGNVEYYGGTCKIFGNIQGNVLSTANGISVNDGSNMLTIMGTVSGTITNQGISTTALYGATNRITVTGGKVYVKSLFAKQLSFDFNVSGGELHFQGHSNISSAVSSVVSGGKVYFDGITELESMLDDQQKYITLSAGALIVRGLMRNKQLSSVLSGKPYLIKHNGGDLVLDGGRLIVDEPDSSPIICTVAQNVKILRVSSNQDFMTSTKLQVLITITAAVNGYTYNFGAANYTAIVTDTEIDIATALAAAIVDPAVVITDNLDGTFTAEAVTAGTPFSYTPSAANMEALIQRNNHVAPTDLITGTPTNTRYLFDALITE